MDCDHPSTPRPLLASVLLASSLLGGAAEALAPQSDPRGEAPLPDHWFGPGPLHRVFAADTDRASLASLRARGAVVDEIDYGAFAVAFVDEKALGGAGQLRASGLRVRDELALMAFGGLRLDTTRPGALLSELDPALTLGDPLGAELHPDAGLYVVQFRAPIRDAWVAALDGLGVRFRQYIPMNAYVVALDSGEAWRLELHRWQHREVQYVGVYEPAFRLTPGLRQAVTEGTRATIPVTIQLVHTRGVRAALSDVRTLAEGALHYSRVGPYVNVSATVPTAHLPTLAAHPHVFAVEERGVRVLFDERQGQTVAGNVSGPSPTGPGYLSWLAGAGFDASQFGSFSVNVVDDATFLTGHPDLPGDRVAFQLNPTSQGGSQGGHGFLNAHIVAGFDDGSGGAFEDAQGFQYGLGIAPWAHVGATAIFGPGGLDPTSYESAAFGLGARISTNSWGFQSGGAPVPDYDTNAQEFDFIVRDAQPSTAGNQDYMVIFAAGNYGPGSNTVSTPSTAKNVLTVGASENDRQTGSDGCGVSNSGANDVDDIISFSSRGPVNSAGGDGRWKPETVAPGTHIQAGVPQSSYSGTSVCNQFWPGGQTLYGWSSGTSHSTPAVAGGAVLVHQWFLNQGLGAPSGAMKKAVLVASGEYMSGAGAGGALPSNSQGTGRMNLGRSFDATLKMSEDQGQVLGVTGETFVLAGDVADPTEPFRVTLAWTDAPGSTTGAPFVNDLDLTVDVGGVQFLGNQFTGATSASGGTPDVRNNTESVFLPAGTSGAFVVTVTAANLAGDGVPGNGDSTDQDFAVWVHNGTVGGVTGPFAQFSGTPTSGLVPLQVSFSDSSVGDVSAWSWDFGDGGSSTAQNPVYTYANPGSYDVSLAVTGPNGSDVQTVNGYITAATPPPPGIGAPSFEVLMAGTAPASPWSVFFGAGHVVDPTGAATDGAMPVDGANWLEVAADSTDGATPPSNPGGATTPASGGAGVTQDFTYPAGQAILEFEVAFLRNELANETSYNDWMSVDVSDGTTTFNLLYLDTFSPTSGTSAKYGYAMTPVEAVSADLLALFPSSTSSTLFTLTALVGNGGDDFQPSKGYVDAFRHVAPAIPLVADFSGTPLGGDAPLAVTFTDVSTGGAAAWSWDFGDGETSTQQNPVHVYKTPGTFSVSLTVTGPAGQDALTKPGHVTVTGFPSVGTPFGDSTPGSLGSPANEAYGDLSPLSTVVFAAGNVPPGTAVYTAISTSAQAPPLDLTNGLLLNLRLPFLLLQLVVADTGGLARLPLQVPASLSGVSLFIQAFAVDGVGGDAFASSQGLRIDLP